LSWLAHAWAETAPVATVYERAILTLFAHRAYDDGTDCYPSIKTIAAFCLCSESTAKRHLRGMENRGIIGKGDQDAAHRIPKRYRPTVWDLLIPYDWYSADQLAKVNAGRGQRGLPPLSPEDRPPIPAPPEKATRADKGKANPNRSRKKPSA
jgi:helix-turn-helix protein